MAHTLLGLARQHKPERVPVQINQALEETLALRDYDLRMHNIRVHLDLAENLPVTSADPHQLQQVFLNMVNNPVAAVLGHSAEGDLWVRTGIHGERLFNELSDIRPAMPCSNQRFRAFQQIAPCPLST